MNGSLLSGLISQAPDLLLVLTAIFIILIEGLIGKRSRRWPGNIALFGTFLSLVGAAYLAIPALSAERGWLVFSGMAVNDGAASFAKCVILFTLLIGLMMNYRGPRGKNPSGDYYALVLLAAFGALVMSASGHLVTVVLGLEILSIPLYTLAAFDPERRESREAGLKYLILGAFSSGFLALGCALFYAATGSFSFYGSAPMSGLSSLYTMGCALILAGLMFKGGILPFFAWSPDAYEGAPDFAVGLMAALAKTGTFIVLARLLPEILPGLAPTWLFQGLLMIAAGTMLAGNLLALAQTNIKRLLAYSSVAHAGYLFLGIMASRHESTGGVLFYLAVYAPVLVASFQIVSIFPGDRGGHDISDYSGLGRKSPVVAALFSVMLISLAGLPPTAGFIAKAVTFLGAAQGGLVSLVLFAMLVSLIGIYYYLRIIVYMYMREPSEDSPNPAPDFGKVGWLGRTGLWLAALVVIILGLVPGPALNLAIKAAVQLQRIFPMIPG
jgi:NADH-quinone oxidoreductase subunit N